MYEFMLAMCSKHRPCVTYSSGEELRDVHLKEKGVFAVQGKGRGGGRVGI